MRPQQYRTPLFTVFAVICAAFSINADVRAQADTFGSGTNTFSISFVDIGDAGNASDNTGYGAVPYGYRMAVNEISTAMVNKAKASGLANVSPFFWAADQPAGWMTWYEAAAFVNWMNTSTGRQAAYNLTFSGSWSMALWSSADAWQLGGENLYRHKDAYYFLPSENEWYKAAYYNPAGGNYFDFPTGSDAIPTAVPGGTSAGTAIFANSTNMPANVGNAGGLSPNGTMAQGGNVWEWMETAFDGANDSASENRTIRGGVYTDNYLVLMSLSRSNDSPTVESTVGGFRVASAEVIPEPSTYALLVLAATGLGAHVLRRRRK